jgi:eukaryotic-like serine/threonine-protein kinase
MNATASANSVDVQSNLAGRQLGRYEVLTQLAAGGMAAVYIARAQGVAGFERLVAIKVLHPHLAYEHEFISMFLDEARLAARIRHPNVVATLDISDTQGDGYFLVMDYIEGDHLGALLGRAAKRGKRLPSPVVLRILIEALAGLGAAHRLTDEHGQPLMLVHRDVSPHNLMVGSDGISRLTDFGVAKAEVRMASTRAGQFKGKLSYMAPEQASTGEADQRSDLFSMGIILWEALTGRRLFRGENNAATLTKILQDPIPLPSSLWPELAAFDPVLAKALDRDPSKRYQTADEFIEAIELTAPALDGLATPRQVASLVSDLLGEKILEEQKRVRSSIDQLGRSKMGEARLPIPREGSASVSAARALAASSDRSLTPTPSVIGYPLATEQRKLWTGAGIAAIAIIGVVLAMRLSDSDEPAVAPFPVAAPSVAAPAAPTSAVAPETPTQPAAPSAATARPAPSQPVDLDFSNELPAQAEQDEDDDDDPSRVARTRRRPRPAARPRASSMMTPPAPTAPAAPTPAPEPTPAVRERSPQQEAGDLFANPYRR